MGYSPWGCKELDTTKHARTTTTRDGESSVEDVGRGSPDRAKTCSLGMEPALYSTGRDWEYKHPDLPSFPDLLLGRPITRPGSQRGAGSPG